MAELPKNEISSDDDLATLRDLCLRYNARLTPEKQRHRIEIEEIQEDKIGMIIALWMRGRKIPPHVTWGEPYDSGFYSSIHQYVSIYEEDVDEEYPPVKTTPFYKVFNHALGKTDQCVQGQLLGYLGAAIVSYRSYFITLNKLLTADTINSRKEFHDKRIRKLVKPLGLPIKNFEDLMSFLPKLSIIALVYIFATNSYPETSPALLKHSVNNMEDYSKLFEL